MLVGISEAMLVFMFFKLRNNNNFNSFVKILRLKIINKQFKYLHSNLYKLNPLFIKLRMNKGRKVKSYVFQVRSRKSPPFFPPYSPTGWGVRGG